MSQQGRSVSSWQYAVALVNQSTHHALGLRNKELALFRKHRSHRPWTAYCVFWLEHFWIIHSLSNMQETIALGVSVPPIYIFAFYFISFIFTFLTSGCQNVKTIPLPLDSIEFPFAEGLNINTDCCPSQIN